MSDTNACTSCSESKAKDYPNQKIIKLIDIIQEKREKDRHFQIPPYQRPYKWNKDQAIQLLEDIKEHVFLNNRIYRVGTLIVHDNRNEEPKSADSQGLKIGDDQQLNGAIGSPVAGGKGLHIVDGQQRLITFSIILHCLGGSENVKINLPDNNITSNNIKYNLQYIKPWIEGNFSNKQDKELFRAKLTNQCEFVKLTVYDSEEAFQLFDSQNSRGKSLDPHDLLKAFHLREMEGESDEDKATCAERWEKSIENNSLKPIIEDHLFRIRNWSKNGNKYFFTKNEIKEFKGITLSRKQLYPYETSARLLNEVVEDLNEDRWMKFMNAAPRFPFSITMPIINGKRFFEYIDFYIQLKQRVFNESSSDFLKFYHDYCLAYRGAGRVGDIKVRNLYENTLIAFVDRFGTEKLNDFYEGFYKYVYQLRLKKKSISANSIIGANQKNIFNEFLFSYLAEDMLTYKYQKYNLVEMEMVNGVEKIKEFINDERKSEIGTIH